MEINGTLSAIVTGGASGLGEATARMLSSMGAKVAIFDLDIDKGSTIAKELNSDFYEVDVSDVNSVNQAVLDFSKQNEGIQVAVNCAGIGPAAKTVSRGEAHSSELFAKVININFPDINQNEFKGVLATGLSKRDVPAKPIRVGDDSSSKSYRFKYNLSGEPLEDKYMTDAEAVKNGYVSLSVLDYSLNSGNFIEEITKVLNE